MFNYFGSKYWLAKKYPAPLHRRIVEPFAGSAQYSLCYWKHNILLIERDERIFNIWKYLQKATPREILRLPTFQPSAVVTHPIPEARDLIALAMNRGTSTPQRKAGSWPQLPALWERKKQIIAESLHKIRHWKIKHDTFESVHNYKETTWFVDPPYENVNRYRHNINDYQFLAKWCRTRNGQVIVCETGSATWLPFTYFHKSKTMQGHRNEVIWTKGCGKKT